MHSDTMTNGPSFAAQEEYWDERWTQHPGPNGYQRERGRKVLELISALRLVNPRILDLGCATGWFTSRLAQIGTATGVDLSPRAIETAKKRFPGVEYIAGNFYEMAFPENYFDLIVNQEVIAHVPDQPAFLDQVASILKPGGYLVITTANKFIMERVNAAPDPDSHIKTWLSITDFKCLLQRRFRVVKTTSAIPMGDRGVLRIVNSHKLNRCLKLLVGEARVDALKDRAHFGYTLLALAQKK